MSAGGIITDTMANLKYTVANPEAVMKSPKVQAKIAAAKERATYKISSAKKADEKFKFIYKIGYTMYKVPSGDALQREIEEGNVFVSSLKRGKTGVYKFIFTPQFFDDYGNWDYKDRVKDFVGEEISGPNGEWTLVMNKNRLDLQFDFVAGKSIYDVIMLIALQLRYLANTRGSYDGFTEDKAKE